MMDTNPWLFPLLTFTPQGGGGSAAGDGDLYHGPILRCQHPQFSPAIRDDPSVPSMFSFKDNYPFFFSLAVEEGRKAGAIPSFGAVGLGAVIIIITTKYGKGKRNCSISACF